MMSGQEEMSGDKIMSNDGNMHRSAKSQTPPNAVDLLLSCEGLWRGLSFVFSRSDCQLTI